MKDLKEWLINLIVGLLVFVPIVFYPPLFGIYVNVAFVVMISLFIGEFIVGFFKNDKEEVKPDEYDCD